MYVKILHILHIMTSFNPLGSYGQLNTQKWAEEMGSYGNNLQSTLR